MTTDWHIRRTWTYTDARDASYELSTDDLHLKPVLCALGSAGSGKSFELARSAEVERRAGTNVRKERVALLAADAGGLAAALDRLASGLTANDSIYLDALDEAMVPMRTAALELVAWIKRGSGPCPRLRIACRTAVWPKAITGALRARFGDDSVTIAVLQPLRREDVLTAAAAAGLDAEAFERAVEQAAGWSLAEHPMTLSMLLRAFGRSGSLPTRRSDLFNEGTRALVMDQDERFQLGTAIDMSPDEMLDAAERLACYLQFGGKDQLQLEGEPPAHSLHWGSVAGTGVSGGRVDQSALRAVIRSGLFEGDGRGGVRFSHRQFAEYFAGRWAARMPLHTAKALLGNDAGWSAGVAGPLRETAAFAANENADIAGWIADTDPEVIGLSDVADMTLRRVATQGLFAQARAGKLTDAQLGREGFDFRGLKHNWAEEDLRAALRKRGVAAEDVLELAIDLVTAWELPELSDDLASLVLDRTAPLHARVSAGYALERGGSEQARARLTPLLDGEWDDPDWQLRGLAIRCNWPQRLSTEEMLAALKPRRRHSFTGAYEYVYIELDRDGFKADGARRAGLDWAAQHLVVPRPDMWASKVALRIFHAALEETDDPEILARVVDILRECGKYHYNSPLRPLDRDEVTEDGSVRGPLAGRTELRRRLLDGIAQRAGRDESVFWAGWRSPGLLEISDCPWLIARAADPLRSESSRRYYAEWAHMAMRWDHLESVDAWFAHRDVEPIRTLMNYPLMIELGSPEEKRARHDHEMMTRHERPKKKRRSPNPDALLEAALAKMAEDHRWFGQVCRVLTLRPGDTHYPIMDRLLTRTPGWERVSEETRERVVHAAQRYLEVDEESVASSESSAFNTIAVPGMAALWLALQLAPEWLNERPGTWWAHWCWYILKELHPSLHGEDDEIKRDLFRMLWDRAPEAVLSSLSRLVSGNHPDSKEPLRSLLTLIAPIEAAAIDQAMISWVRDDAVGRDRLDDVAAFLLRRNKSLAREACLNAFDRERGRDDGGDSSPCIAMAVVLLQLGDLVDWDRVVALLEQTPQFARRVLPVYAHSERWRSRDDSDDVPAPFDALRVGRLVGLLLGNFPPSGRRDDEDGAWCVGPEDSAEMWRDQFLSALGEQSSAEAVDALRSLEARFGQKYPWLRTPRARVERAYRLSRWSATPPGSLAKILDNGDRRLIRSPQDALAGIIEAIRLYERALHHASPSLVEDLWTLPSDGPPSPRPEERASDKLCDAIRSYFREYAVTTEREVQVHRRKVSRASGGAPGSEVDVVVNVPAAGVASGTPITVPVEVKLSGNREAKTGLKDQLVDRYMDESGAEVGVFVVMWMHAPDMGGTATPVWPSIEQCRQELEVQAEQVSKNEMRVAGLAVDCSLW